MQPYLFPYLGYFQLAAAVDEFWLLDTVQFIRRGWMNRNNLLVNNQKLLFTIPVNSGSRDQLIIDKTYNRDDALKALDKLSKTILVAYKDAPYRDATLNLVRKFSLHLERTDQPVDFTTATEIALRACFDVIGLSTPIRRVSSLGLEDTHTGQARIISVCKAIGAMEYVNMIGGHDLYKRETFAAHGIDLWFLQPVLPQYDQRTPEFESGLSILDVIAHVPPDKIRNMLSLAEVVDPLDHRGI